MARTTSSGSSAAGSTASAGRGNPIRRVVQVYRTVKTVDPQVGRWVLLAVVAVLAVGLLIGLLVDHPILSLVVALPAALLAGMIVLARRGESAAFRQMEGQKGASLGGLSSLRRGWYYDEEPVAADAAKANEVANAAVVFRALGRPGVVLLGEGPAGRAKKLLDKERKKVARVAPGVPIHTYVVGPGEDELAPRKIRWTLSRLRPTLSKEEMAVVNKRLKSLPGIRQGIPGGIDPTQARMNRKALRGR